MATKRVALSAVNWGAISQRVPTKQRDAFNVLKNASDKYIVRIQELPESLPKMDFAQYKSKLPGLQSMVSDFEKQYTALEVPYPKDSNNVKGALEKEEVAVREKSANYIERESKHLHSLQTMLKKIETVPPPEKMTRQMFNYYFPENGINPNRENPGFWPQMEPEFQLQNLRKEGRSQTFIQAPGEWNINIDTLVEFEQEWMDKVIEWEREEMVPKVKPILDGYQQTVDTAMDAHLAQMKESQGEDAVKKFKKDSAAIAAFKAKVLADNGITMDKFLQECTKVVGPVKDLESVKEYLDALEEK